MKPFQANALNALVIIGLGLWGYLGSANPSPTALIPVGFGVIFALCTPMMRKENRVVAHVVVLLTLVLILALFMPLRGAIARADTMGIIRVSIMLATAVLAMAIFVKSFIDARRARKA